MNAAWNTEFKQEFCFNAEISTITNHKMKVNWSLHGWIHLPKGLIYICFISKVAQKTSFSKQGQSEIRTSQIQCHVATVNSRLGAAILVPVKRPEISWHQLSNFGSYAKTVLHSLSLNV